MQFFKAFKHFLSVKMFHNKDLYVSENLTLKGSRGESEDPP